MGWCEYCGYCEHGPCADPCPCPGKIRGVQTVLRPEREQRAAQAYWVTYHAPVRNEAPKDGATDAK